MNIRKTAPEDAEALNRLIDSVARERVYLASTEGFGVESTLKFIEFVRSQGGIHIVGIKEGKIIGWCDITPGHFEGTDHVGRLGMGLLPEERGQGYGQQLIEYAIREAFAGKIKKIELEVFGSNKSAIALYEKNGFELEGCRKEARRLDGRVDEALLYALFKPNRATRLNRP